MTAPKFLLQEIKDQYAQENFRRLDAFLRADALQKGAFLFFTHTFTRAETKLKLPHNLGFQPSDVLQLSVGKPDTATVTWHYDSFDKTNIVLSSSGACTVRAYIGRYGEGE